MSQRTQCFQEMTRSIDLLYSYSFKQNNHKICSVSFGFYLQITLTCADDRCGHDRTILTFTWIWRQSFRDEKPTEKFNWSFIHAIIVLLNFVSYKHGYRSDIGNPNKDNSYWTKSPHLIRSQYENYFGYTLENLNY
jgi:hypothetical protein